MSGIRGGGNGAATAGGVTTGVALAMGNVDLGGGGRVVGTVSARVGLSKTAIAPGRRALGDRVAPRSPTARYRRSGARLGGDATRSVVDCQGVVGASSSSNTEEDLPLRVYISAGVARG